MCPVISFQRYGYTECLLATTDNALIARIETIFDEYGAEDIDWPGSHIFQEIPGFYDHYRAQQPVPGFDYDPARDFEPMYSDPIGDVPVGRPTCKEWWADPAIGLRQKIVDASDGGFVEDIWDSISGMWNDLSKEQVDDRVVRRA